MHSPNKPTPRELPPDVLAALQAAVQQHITQTAVAKLLRVSPAVINHLLRGRYAGDVERMAELIRGAFMAATVTCPVYGELGRQHCLEYQARPLVNTNPMRARLFRECQTCPNRRNP